jgi:hypothetical protein
MTAPRCEDTSIGPGNGDDVEERGTAPVPTLGSIPAPCASMLSRMSVVVTPRATVIRLTPVTSGE